eukprot:TRINITY_DN6429_c0_g1_i1.p1 TRINITY_DN6429_c0_g1~~TRINITY_DN6429_c0_g1_i1.p1  ORF type:complete len:389 (+),score=49.59 TRINITY_DN6429_c0_g1_i1:28-1167(+)
MAIEAACFAGGVVSLALAGCAGKAIRRCAFSQIADRQTGKQRRQNSPIDVINSEKTLPGSYEAEVCPHAKLKNVRGFVSLKDGRVIFYQYWLPRDAADIEALRGALVFFHGYGDESDFTTAHKAQILCSLGRFGAIAFDMPGFGRSDGDFAYIPDWHAYIDDVREILLDHIRPIVDGWRSKSLKLFGVGESMGGGVLFSMLVRENQLMAGVVLICPMLFVSEKLYPPWIVVQLFKHVLAPIAPTWPQTPGEDLNDKCFSDPAMVEFCNSSPGHNGLKDKGKAKLATANQLAFVAGAWMKARIPEFDVPCLIVHSAADEVCDPSVSQMLFDGMKGNDKELMMPPIEEGLCHGDLFHGGVRHKEGCRQRFATVVAWLEARC